MKLYLTEIFLKHWLNIQQKGCSKAEFRPSGQLNGMAGTETEIQNLNFSV